MFRRVNAWWGVAGEAHLTAAPPNASAAATSGLAGGLRKRRQCSDWTLLALGFCLLRGPATANSAFQTPHWQPIGISGGGAMFTPAISPADPNLMMLNCDMSAAYISEDGGRSWRMIHHAQLRSDTVCRPAFHPTDPNILYASSGGQLKISPDPGKTFPPI